MAHRLSEQILIYYWLEPENKLQWNLQLNEKKFSFDKKAFDSPRISFGITSPHPDAFCTPNVKITSPHWNITCPQWLLPAFGRWAGVNVMDCLKIWSAKFTLFFPRAPKFLLYMLNMVTVCYLNNNTIKFNRKCYCYWSILSTDSWGIGYLLWNCLQMNVTGPYLWLVNISSGNILVPSGNKPLPEQMLTQICVTIWRN